MKLYSFDIETSNVFDLKPGEDLEKYAPFHPAVAAGISAGAEPTVWLTKGTDGKPLKDMSRETAVEVLTCLRQLQRAGHALCAWNGASFDLRWLGFAAGDFAAAGEIALDLYDPMFQFFNRKGFPVGLDAVASGMGIGLRKSLRSEDAPRLWRAGRHDEVIAYVCGDAKMTLAVVEAIQKTGSIRWITQKGERKTESLGRLKTVREVLKEPEPEQSWMTKPIRRSKFVRWIVNQ